MIPPPHLSHLAVLGIAREATSAALSLLIQAHAKIQMALKLCNAPEQPIREELEDAYVAVDQSCRILGITAGLTAQEHKLQTGDIEASERVRLVSGLRFG